MDRPKLIKRAIGKVERGAYYKGFAATGRDGNEFILITSDMAGLRTLWDKLMSITPLDENAVQEVAVFSLTKVTPDSKEQ
jgi:hypothetical protein